MSERASVAWPRIDLSRAMLILAVACQAITVAITWPLWLSRESPVNLPLFTSMPDLSFGWAMLVSLVVAAVRPKFGVPIHWGVLIVASAFDQFRLEPQFFGLAVLMLAGYGDGAAGDIGRRICRWCLIAMWIWTGLHKFLSPDWMGHSSWSLVSQAGFNPEYLHRPFAIVVATTEVTLGLLAWLRPQWAARMCVAVHLGIVVFMSPLFAGMNVSVIPWNIAIAGIGYWLLQSFDTTKPEASRPLPTWERLVAAVLLVLPSGFYFGVDRCFCHVMYSNYLPHALVTNKESFETIRGWDDVAVPFPRERRLFQRYFERTAEPGDKLHIGDPRSMLDDQFFVMRSTGVVQIDADEFFRLDGNEVAGVGQDRKQSLFAFSRAGVKMLREQEGAMVYAVAFTKDTFDRGLLKYLAGLPNLQQIQFSDTAIRDDDLVHLKSLRLLAGLGLNHTKITDQGLSQLDELPYLEYFETEGTSIKNYDQN